MQEDDDARRIVAAALKLDRMGIDELQAYIAARRAEIALAEAEITRKQAHRSATESVFRSS